MECMAWENEVHQWDGLFIEYMQRTTDLTIII